MYTADLHCDTISKIYHSRKRKEAAELRSNPFQVDIQKLRQGNYILQNFAVFVDLEQDGDPYQCAKDQIAVLKAEIHKNADKIRQVTSVTEILQNQAAHAFPPFTMNTISSSSVTGSTVSRG